MSAKDATPKKKTGVARLFELIGKRKINLSFACFFSVLSSASRMVPYFTIYGVIRQVLYYFQKSSEFSTQTLLKLTIATLISAFAYGFLGFISTIIAHNAAFDILYELRIKLMEKMGKIHNGYYTSMTQGAIKKIIVNDVEQIETFVAHNLVEVVSAVATPVFTLIFLFIMDWRLALVSLVPIFISLFFLASGLKNPEGAQTQVDMAKDKEKMEGTIVEYIHGMSVIKIFGRTSNAFKQLETNISNFVNTVKRTAIFFANRMGAYYAFFGAQLLFLLPAATLIIMKSGQSYMDFIPTVLLFLLVGGGLKEPLENMMNVSVDTSKINAGVERIDELLGQSEVTVKGEGKVPETNDIEFKNVTFSYDGKKDALTDINFSLKQGTINALVGPSGGGKSTIAQLILRFYEAQKGSISIGGIPTDEITWDCLTSKVSYVFQNSFLFSDTIENNIRMGNTKISHEMVVEAAKNANIHDVIMSLPKGYDTVIGEKNTYLSGGEQQRIAIARVFLKNTPIVILDEATAYADAENETKIQEAFARLSKNKTVLIIAHRLRSIQNADQILVVDGGKIVSKGTHEELLKNCDLYKTMIDANERRDQWSVRKA